jgi:hypothetical protein
MYVVGHREREPHLKAGRESASLIAHKAGVAGRAELSVGMAGVPPSARPAEPEPMPIRARYGHDAYQRRKLTFRHDGADPTVLAGGPRPEHRSIRGVVTGTDDVTVPQERQEHHGQGRECQPDRSERQSLPACRIHGALIDALRAAPKSRGRTLRERHLRHAGC